MTWEVAVRVTFVQSGGVAGVPRECEMDTALLPPEDARELEALVAASALPVSGDYRSAEARDLRVYEIRIGSDAGGVAVTFDDHTLPESAQPLVSYLRRSAHPRGGA